MESTDQVHKAHHAPRAGRSAEKKKVAHRRKLGLEDKPVKLNQRAFGGTMRDAAREVQRKLDRQERNAHVPKAARDYLDVVPPTVIAVVGPPGCGKTTLIKSLVKYFARQTLRTIKGPVTVVAGRGRRITFLECTQDLNVMCDIARVADLVLLLVDASFGFEMETFEFLNIAQSHGFPKVIGCLTFLDKFKKAKRLKKTKKVLKHRFWKEVAKGSKLFYLSGVEKGLYLPREMLNLSRFISVATLKPQTWRTTHPAILVDRMEDLTPAAVADQDPTAPRSVCMYGFMRGKALRPNQKVHIPGVGDFSLSDVSVVEDPCPLPKRHAVKNRQRHLTDKMRRLYAPMSDIGDLLYDQHSVFLTVDRSVKRVGQGITMLQALASDRFHVDERLEEGGISLLARGEKLEAAPRTKHDEAFDDEEYATGPVPDDDDDDDDSGNDDGEDGEEDDEPLASELRPDGTRRRRAVFPDDDAAVQGIRRKSEADLEDDPEEVDEDEAEAEVEGEDEPLAGRLLPASWNPPAAGGHDTILLNDAEDDDLEEDGAPLFTPMPVSDLLNAEDITRERPPEPRNWEVDSLRETLRNLFVTGQWTAEESAKHGGTPAFEMVEDGDDDDGDDNPNADGDEEQEDSDAEGAESPAPGGSGVEAEGLRDQLEYWKKFQQKARGLDTGDVAQTTPAPTKTEDEEMAAYRKKKLRTKQEFDKDYDSMNHLEQMKADVQERQSKLKEVLDRLPAIEERVKTFGYYEGLYVRVVLDKVPAEFLRDFDPHRPVVIGGLLPHEEKVGVVYMRIKKHRWYPKILKSNDPLVMSIGWRRFQTMPIFAIEDQNGRHRFLKYTPMHMHCIAVFWGPVFPPNTGVMCFQNIMDNASRHFRPAATGYIMQSEKSSCVVKKIRLTGSPARIMKHTCFIKNMFNSPLEVAKFEGAKLKTVSGIRGCVKKAVPNKRGIFRAVFEDKILMSDIVNLRTWKAVAPEHFYNPVTDLLKGAGWRAMRTQNELRKLHGVPIPVKRDSIYRAGPADRANKSFKNLVVPEKLIKDLPFKEKAKHVKKVGKKQAPSQMDLAIKAATARVFSPEETARHKFLQAVRQEVVQRKPKPRATRVVKRALEKKGKEQQKRRREAEMKARKKRKLTRDAVMQAGAGVRKHNASKRKAARKGKKKGE